MKTLIRISRTCMTPMVMKITGTNADKKLTNSNAIINEKEGAALEWSKVDGTDGSTALAGSEWQLQKKTPMKPTKLRILPKPLIP